MELIKEIMKPQDYAPVVIGATAGLVGGSYIDQQAKSWVAALAPGNDWADIGARIGLAVGAIAVYLATDKTNKNAFETGINSAAVSATAVMAFSLVAKVLGWTSMTIGRAGPVRAMGRQNVVRKDQIPTFSQATPVGAMPASQVKAY